MKADTIGWIFLHLAQNSNLFFYDSYGTNNPNWFLQFQKTFSDLWPPLQNFLLAFYSLVLLKTVIYSLLELSKPVLNANIKLGWNPLPRTSWYVLSVSYEEKKVLCHWQLYFFTVFTSVINNAMEYAIVFVSGSHFHPSLIVFGKGRSLPLERNPIGIGSSLASKCLSRWQWQTP